jgi:two-component sensor histidine kinase
MVASLSGESDAMPGLDVHASTRVLLWAVALATSLMALLATGTLIAVQYRMAIHEAELTGQTTARLLEEHALRSLDTSLLLLDRLKDKVEAAGFERTDTSELEWHKITHMASGLPQVEMLGALNAKGDSIFMTGELPGSKINLSDRESFQAHRAGARLVIGRTIRTRTTGKLSFTVSKRVAGPDDRFAGVVVAVTPLSYFADLYDSLNIGPGGTIGLMRDDGVVVARHPWRDESLEGPIASSDLDWIQTANAASSSHVAQSAVDGVKHIGFYRKLPGYPLLVFATIGIDDAMAHWRTETLWTGGLVAFGLTLVWGLSGFAMRAIRREEDARQRCIVAQSGLQQAVADRDLLFAEIHHRIKNNFQSIESLLRIMAGRRSGETRQDLNQARERLHAMSSVHETLYRSGQVSRVDFAIYLNDICAKLGESHDLEARGIALQVDAAPVTLDMKTAMPLGLIATELISNAIKHAFPGDRTGTIRVEMDSRRLVVRDDGIGLAPGPEKRGGFGMDITQALVNQIGARISMEDDNGHTVIISLPEAAQPIAT